MRRVDCPEPGLLTEFALGMLPYEDAVALVGHTTRCADCQTRLSELDTQTDLLIDRLRTGLSMEPEMAAAEQADSQRLLAKLEARNLLSQTSEPIPDRVLQYRILGRLGEGGMGLVYLGEDATLHRTVAIKCLKRHLAEDGSARQRFLLEAQAMASIKHPNIVALHYVGLVDELPILVMERLEGESLETRLERKEPISIAQLVRWGSEIAGGLAAAHARGLVHRDVKPANIWLESRDGSEPVVKVLDFGLARAGNDDARLTREGIIVGTPAFMAPEQARGSDATVRSDSFSLGCVLYQMATGVSPFHASTTMGVLTALAVDRPAASPARASAASRDRKVDPAIARVRSGEATCFSGRSCPGTASAHSASGQSLASIEVAVDWRGRCRRPGVGSSYHSLLGRTQSRDRQGQRRRHSFGRQGQCQSRIATDDQPG